MTPHHTMKDLPVGEQPYNRFLEVGASQLSDAQLLSILIKTGTKDLTSIQIAEEILNSREGNLLNLFQIPYEELLNIPGIGKVKAIELKAVAEIAKRTSRLSYKKGLHFQSADAIASYYMEELRHDRKESVMACYFDSKANWIDDFKFSGHGNNYSMFPIGEIAKKALLSDAVSVAVLHNHPSGDPSPSREDVELTKSLKNALSVLELHLLDHIIIGDRRYFSFWDHGML